MSAADDPTQHVPPLDVDRLWQARTDVEAGYIAQPDRHARAYWQKIADRYDYLATLDATPPAEALDEPWKPMEGHNHDERGYPTFPVFRRRELAGRCSLRVRPPLGAVR